MPDTQLDRIEALLTMLVDALTEPEQEDDDHPPARTLEGEPAGGERDQTQSL